MFPDDSLFQSLEIPPLCNTVTVYVDWKKARSHPGDAAPGTPGSPSNTEAPVKFALSRSRRSVNDSDFVATISLKKQQSNSWFQRHLPLPHAPFSKILIGPIDNRSTTAAKDESTVTEHKAESSGDKSNPLEDGAAVSSSQRTCAK